MLFGFARKIPQIIKKSKEHRFKNADRNILLTVIEMERRFDSTFYQ